MTSFSRFVSRQFDRKINICMCHGSGALSCWFLLVDRMLSWLRPMGTGRSARVLRFLEQSATEQLRRRASGSRSSEQGAADGQVDTRVLVRTDKWHGSEKACPIWSFVTRAYAWEPSRSRFVVGHDECRDQHRREQRAAWRCAAVCRLDHVVHKKGSGLCCECNVQLAHVSMENVLF